MPDQVVFVHGWSAKANSMNEVAGFLRDQGYRTVDLFLGSYPSTDDDVQIADVARRMETVIRDRQALGASHPDRIDPRFHVVIHSTGALVVRQWLADRHEAGLGSPVDNFLMLAPANFGSPLAKTGRGLLGRLKVGLGNKMQSGTEVLHALELGSQFQEDLALRDRLSVSQTDLSSPYDVGQTRPFVIVGSLQIDGTQVLNQTGWDGTVRIASSHLDPQGVSVDFSDDGATPRLRKWHRRGRQRTAFAVLPDRDHLSILRPSKGDAVDGPYKDRLGRLIKDALAVRDETAYEALTQRWADEVNDETRWLASNSKEARLKRREIFGKVRARRIPTERFHEHYQVVVNVSDAEGHPVDEFGIWLSAPGDKRRRRRGSPLADDELEAHLKVLRSVHVNARSPSRRVLHLDRYKLMGPDGYFKTNVVGSTLMAAISAPAIGDNVSFGHADDGTTAPIGLRTSQRGSELSEDDETRFLRRYATHFIDVKLPRVVNPDVFRLQTYKGR